MHKLSYEERKALKKLAITGLEVVDFFKKINVYGTIVIIIFGLIGHFITVNVYSRKRNRVNSISGHFFKKFYIVPCTK